MLLPLPQAFFHMTASLQDDWDSRLLEFDRAVRSAAPFWQACVRARMQGGHTKS